LTSALAVPERAASTAPTATVISGRGRVDPVRADGDRRDRVRDTHREVVVAVETEYRLRLQRGAHLTDPRGHVVGQHVAGRIGDVDAVRAVRLHQLRLHDALFRRRHVRHHQESDGIAPERARKADMLFRHVGIGATTIAAACAFVKAGYDLPRGVLLARVPARVVRRRTARASVSSSRWIACKRSGGSTARKRRTSSFRQRIPAGEKPVGRRREYRKSACDERRAKPFGKRDAMHVERRVSAIERVAAVVIVDRVEYPLAPAFPIVAEAIELRDTAFIAGRARSARVLPDPLDGRIVLVARHDPRVPNAGSDCASPLAVCGIDDQRDRVRGVHRFSRGLCGWRFAVVHAGRDVRAGSIA